MKRTKSNLSNYKLTTADMGQLVPVQLQEVLPGDTMQMSTSALIRVSPMIAPVMHPCTVRFHHWFVPTRLLWDGWEDFITGGPDNANADTVPTRTLNLNDTVSGRVMDHLGVPRVEGLTVNSMPLTAYNLIYNEFYRDQDLEPTERSLTNNTLANVSWRKDYFTTARPFSQKGADITIPIGTSAPVLSSNNDSLFLKDTSNNSMGLKADTAGAPGSSNISKTLGTNVASDLSLDLVADLSSATGITANEFRELFALQRYAEARASYGSRYTEYLRYLGVKPADGRLQRPEYLGGGKSTLQFSEVLTTVDTVDDSAGTMRGHGITALKTRKNRRFFEEHGYVITLMSVVPKSIYQDGVNRLWLRQDKEDFYQKELQNIGQQKVKQGEVDASVPADVHNTFGYSDRYSDYTSVPSTISGEFRDTLDYWHLARKWSTTPALNEDFIKCVPSKRIHAEQTQNTLWCMVNNSVIARRMVSKKSIGRLM